MDILIPIVLGVAFLAGLIYMIIQIRRVEKDRKENADTSNGGGGTVVTNPVSGNDTLVPREDKILDPIDLPKREKPIHVVEEKELKVIDSDVQR